MGGIMNISKILHCQSHLANSMNLDKPVACSKKPAVLPAQPLHSKTCLSSGQAAGALAPGAHGVREDDKGPTCLREAAPAKAGNAAGGLFQQVHRMSYE